MSEPASQSTNLEPPAMGERRARWGYGYQDKVATERILNFLRRDLRDGGAEFEGVRLADLEAGPVDDFVLVWKQSIEGNSIKWSGDGTAFTWGELIGASGLLRDLAAGWNRLRARWPGRLINVRLQTNRPTSSETPCPNRPCSQLDGVRREYWPSGPDTADSAETTEAWRKIAEHVGLSGIELSDFVAHCQLSFGQVEPPGGRSDSLDWRHYQKQFDSLHKSIATWLTNNPEADFIERDYLLAAIGLHTSRAGLIQRFPEPDIPYEKNHEAADRFRALIDTLPGGYIAVRGPAGVGKSTLVQDVLTDSAYPLFVPYYAFLPSTDGNRDRAEALTFFQDVVARLDRFEPVRKSLGIADIAQGRDALRRHMASANQRYVLQGHKTILLIDGLDHVMREVNLQMPVLHELPHPNEIPEGFVIVLSGQPQSEAFLLALLRFAPICGVEPVGQALTDDDQKRLFEPRGRSRNGSSRTSLRRSPSIAACAPARSVASSGSTSIGTTRASKSGARKRPQAGAIQASTTPVRVR
jgi:AAA domain-containing protein